MKYFFIFFFLPIVAIGQTFTSTQNGNFGSNSTWVGSRPDNEIDAGVTVIINHNVINNQNIVVEGTLIINASGSLTGDNRKIEVLDGGKLIAYGLITTQQLKLEGSNSRAEINDSIFVKNQAEVNDNAKLIVTGNAFFDQKLVLEDADSVFFAGKTFIDDDFEIKGNSKLFSGSGATITADKKMKVSDDVVINFDGNLIVNDDLEIKDDATFASNGTVLVEDKFEIQDDVVINLFGDLRVNNDIEADDDILLNIFANAYIADDINADGNANITIGSSSIVQVKDVINFDGGTLTINGAMVVEGGVNTNESFNDGNIIGTGLLQVDGNGIDNQGTIAGSLDVCSGDGSTNPVSGNALSGSATSCSLSGINFPIIPAAPLPVELENFYYSANEESVDLIWITLSEINSDYFSIEHSDDGIYFSEIGKIKASGNSNKKNEYRFNHSNPKTGQNYYRLIQYDYDGKHEEFDPILVEWKKIKNETTNIVIYPNPNNGEKIYISLPKIDFEELSVFINGLYQLDNFNDLTLINNQGDSLIIVEFDKKLNPGIYSINILINSNVITKKLIVQ